MMQAVVLVAGILMGTCLMVGGVIVIGLLLWGRTPAAALQWIDYGYFVIIGLLPVALWLALYISYDDADYAPAYATPWRALLTALQGALVGSILGAGPIFLTVAINIPVVVLGFDPNTFGPDVRNAIVWSRLAVAVGAAALSALPLGLWAHYAGSERERD